MNVDIFEKTMVNMKWPEIDNLAKKDALVIPMSGIQLNFSNFIIERVSIPHPAKKRYKLTKK